MTVDIHEKYCVEFNLNDYTSSLLEEYDSNY